MGQWIAVGGTMDCCWWDNGLLLVRQWIAVGGTVDCCWWYNGLLLVVQWVAIGGTVDCYWWYSGFYQVVCLNLKTSGSPNGLVTTRSSSSQTGCGLG